MNKAIIWLFITLFCIGVQGFYSMLEMAIVSFNRVRLQYYVSKKNRRAIWLQYIIQRPSRLFCTIMLGVNIALQVGSQSSREFYSLIGLNPDLAPITQIFLVVIFAELAPMFAARRFAENVAMLGIPIVYATYRLFNPLIWFISILVRVVYFLFGKKERAPDSFLNRDELQKILESRDEENEFNNIVANIFSLHNKTASQVMMPLSQVDMVHSNATLAQLYKIVSNSSQSFVPIYNKTRSNIVAIALPKDFVSLSDDSYAMEKARPPWFITSSSTLTPILNQFRSNKESVSVVLDTTGEAVGILTLDMIIEEIFGDLLLSEKTYTQQNLPVINRTFPGNTKIVDFNREYGTDLPVDEAETLAQLMITFLDHYPTSGDSIIIHDVELTAEETTLLGIKSISVKTSL